MVPPPKVSLGQGAAESRACRQPADECWRLRWGRGAVPVSRPATKPCLEPPWRRARRQGWPPRVGGAGYAAELSRSRPCCTPNSCSASLVVPDLRDSPSGLTPSLHCPHAQGGQGPGGCAGGDQDGPVPTLPHARRVRRIHLSPGGVRRCTEHFATGGGRGGAKHGWLGAAGGPCRWVACRVMMVRVSPVPGPRVGRGKSLQNSHIAWHARYVFLLPPACAPASMPPPSRPCD